MLHQIRGKLRRASNTFLSAANSGGLGFAPAVPFIPSDLPNLSNWFLDTGITRFLPADFCSGEWADNENPPQEINGSIGDCVPPPAPPNGIITINGLNALNAINGGLGMVLGSTLPATVNKSTFTMGGIYKSDSATNGHLWDMAPGAGGFTRFAIQQPAGNKLRFFNRSNNMQVATIDSVTNVNGAGWLIVIVSFDGTAKTAKMYEGGNTISLTNGAMNTFTWNVGQSFTVFNVTAGGIANDWIGAGGEFFIFSDVKAVADINLLGNYLAGKYALAWTDV